LRWATALALAALTLTGCSTHEFRYEGGVPPEPLTAQQRVDTAHEIVTTLLRRFAPTGARLSPAAAAIFAEAALIDAQATRSSTSRRTAMRLAESLLRDRLPVGVGLAYPGATGRAPDPAVTWEVARTLLFFDKITHESRWRQGAARAVQALVTPRLGWSRWRDG
jgi:hypothetical protein